MKTLFITAAVLFFTGSAMAQSFSWVTNDTIETDLDLNTTVLLKMEQTVAQGDTTTLGIEVVYNDLPSSWDGMVCVWGQCLGIIPPVGTTAEMSPIFGVDNGYVRLTVNPLSGNEFAKLRITVYDLDSPSVADTATWILNPSSVGVLENEETSFEVYPNPANETIQVNSEKPFERVNIYDLNGKMHFSQMTNSSIQQNLNISELASGVYIIELEEGNHSSRQRIVVE